MKARLWYPQLDPYDAARRIAGLLVLWRRDKPPSRERLFIADFYLANPPLLYPTQMSRDVRRAFQKLKVRRPEKLFVSYPSAPLLFQKMGPVQNLAFQTLVGKGLIDLAELEEGVVRPSPDGQSVFEHDVFPLFSEEERMVASFLTEYFVQPENEIGALRRSTGLRRVS